MVCKDRALSALDRKLADAYAQATKQAVNEHPPVLKTEQRGWIEGRDDCWKSEDKRGCVEAESDRTADADRRAPRQHLAEAPAAVGKRSALRRPQRKFLGAQGEAAVTRDYGAPVMKCRAAP